MYVKLDFSNIQFTFKLNYENPSRFFLIYLKNFLLIFNYVTAVKNFLSSI
jgi:hypothetical protein